MKKENPYKILLVFSLIGLLIFAGLWWLFNLGMPSAAIPFSIGTTAIIVSGGFSGYYISNLFSNNSNFRHNFYLWVFAMSSILMLVLLSLLVNEMIENTRFSLFIFSIITLFLCSLFLGLVINLTRNRIKSNLRSSQAALALSKKELEVIQSQISPHFLFNTLNNLYGFSLTEPQKVPHLILKLSDLLRYSIYEVKDEWVPLSYEIDYLKNYIEFEKIRLGNRLNLVLDFPDNIKTEVTISPLLLIVFVENAFKHSKNNDDEIIYIHIGMRVRPDGIYFFVFNSYSYLAKEFMKDNSYSGFGLENVKKRLDLIYPNKYDLIIDKSNGNHSVKLYLKKS